MIGGKVAQCFSHAGGYPAIAAAPEEGHIGRVVEKAVGLLKFVKISDHLCGVAIEILFVAGGAIGLELKDREHIHVIDPEAGLIGETVGCWVLPLLVGP